MSPAEVTPRRRAAVWMALAWALLDQATKQLAVQGLRVGEPVDLAGPLALELVRNPGAAFGLSLPGPALAAATAVVLVAVVLLGRRQRAPAPLAALALVAGGALGNGADRLLRGRGALDGAVVDFLRVAEWWPVFNLADAGIVVGAVGVALTAGLGPRRRQLDEPSRIRPDAGRAGRER